MNVERLRSNDQCRISTGKWKMEFTPKLSPRHSLDKNEAQLEGVILLIRH